MSLYFDDREIACDSDQTVAGALLAAGILSWRTTRTGDRPRGLFCGIGVCQDCLVVIDGAPDQRACLTPARDGMVVRTQIGTGRD
jgi:predicted molibdopterin-dependent oxidoreductase YjgC